MFAGKGECRRKRRKINNNNNLLIGCSITRVVYIEVLITRCILYNTIKIPHIFLRLSSVCSADSLRTKNLPRREVVTIICLELVRTTNSSAKMQSSIVLWLGILFCGISSTTQGNKVISHNSTVGSCCF